MLLNELQAFPAGPLQVPSESHPELRIEWGMTAWIGFEDPFVPKPEKSLIMRKYMPEDTSGLSCWAWYAKVCPTLAPLHQSLPAVAHYSTS